MSRVANILFQGQLGATNTDIYIVPTGKKATITAIEVSNCDTATHNFTLYRVPSGGSVADSKIIGQKMNKLVGTSDTGGGGYWVREIPTPLNSVGDKIVGIADTTNMITITIIGFEE